MFSHLWTAFLRKWWLRQDVNGLKHSGSKQSNKETVAKVGYLDMLRMFRQSR